MDTEMRARSSVLGAQCSGTLALAKLVLAKPGLLAGVSPCTDLTT